MTPVLQPFFSVTAAPQGSDNEPDVVEIFSVIGDYWEGSDDFSFANRVKALKSPNLTVKINSFGGDFKAGLGIANFLRGSGKTVTTECVGVAASAASFIFCAGSKRIMRAGAQVMIHNAAAGTYGQAKDMTETAKTLEGFDEAATEFYAMATGLPKSDIKALMDATTWMRSDRAVELGFATEKEPALKAVACAAPEFAYAFKNNSNVMSAASLTHPALLELAALLPAAPESEADLVAGIKNFASELSAHKAELINARASIQTLTVRADLADKALSDAQTAHVKALADTEAKVDEKARFKAAEIVQAAALPKPVAFATVTKPEEKTMSRAAFNSIPHGERNAFMASGGKLTD